MPLIESSGSSGGGGSGTVTNVSSADSSIVVTNPTTTPSLKVGTMDVLFTNEPPAAAVPMNTQKLTGLAAGTTNGDSVRFEQVVKSGAVTAADTSIVVGGTGVAPTIATGTLDVIATNHPPAAAVPMNAQKITGLANGSAATDAAAFGQLSGLALGVSIFGDGSDGSVTFDGSTTILGMAPSSSVYTLTRDFFFSAVTLNNNVQIKTNGFRLFCSGTWTGGGAGSIIQWNGSAAAVTAAGAATNNTNGSVNNGNGGTSPGTAGSAGGTTTGTAGTNSTNYNLGGIGGVGGTGNGGANAGGAAGTLTAGTAVQGTIRAAPAALIGRAFGGGTVASAFAQISGGTGGGSGAGDGTAGGGSGSGGGIVCVYVRTFAGTGAIQARGGAGGTPAGGNRGAGAGGGGGVVIVVSQSVSAGAISGWTIDANAGAAGSPTGNGGAAGAAAAGITVILPA